MPASSAAAMEPSHREDRVIPQSTEYTSDERDTERSLTENHGTLMRVSVADNVVRKGVTSASQTTDRQLLPVPCNNTGRGLNGMQQSPCGKAEESPAEEKARAVVSDGHRGGRERCPPRSPSGFVCQQSVSMPLCPDEDQRCPVARSGCFLHPAGKSGQIVTRSRVPRRPKSCPLSLFLPSQSVSGVEKGVLSVGDSLPTTVTLLAEGNSSTQLPQQPVSLSAPHCPCMPATASLCNHGPFPSFSSSESSALNCAPLERWASPAPDSTSNPESNPILKSTSAGTPSCPVPSSAPNHIMGDTSNSAPRSTTGSRQGGTSSSAADSLGGPTLDSAASPLASPTLGSAASSTQSPSASFTLSSAPSSSQSHPSRPTASLASITIPAAHAVLGSTSSSFSTPAPSPRPNPASNPMSSTVQAPPENQPPPSNSGPSAARSQCSFRLPSLPADLRPSGSSSVSAQSPTRTHSSSSMDSVDSGVWSPSPLTSPTDGLFPASTIPASPPVPQSVAPRQPADSGSTSPVPHPLGVHRQANSRVKCLTDYDRLERSVRALEDACFYYPELDSDGARALLQDAPLGTFLVRGSSDSRFLFAVSLKTERGPTSVRIRYERGLFQMDCEDQMKKALPRFETMLELLDFHSAVCRDSQGAQYRWLEASRRKDLLVRLSDPRRHSPPTLMHLARVTVNRSLEDLHLPFRSTDLLPVPVAVRQFLRDYPYRV